jgi:bacteriocin biosynthesis cyclodehydratase domain-containing protein
MMQQSQLGEPLLRLRRDAVYLKTDEGIVFRSKSGPFALKGAGIYATFRALVPYLDGKHTRRSILGALREGQRAAVDDLLQVLLDRSVLGHLDPDDEALVDPAVADLFAPNIDFIGHVADERNRRFLAFRDARILLAGSGVGLESAGVALMRNGLRHLHVATADRDAAAAFDRECGRISANGVSCDVTVCGAAANGETGNVDFVIYCSEQPDLRAVHDLTARTAEAGFRFLPAVVCEVQSIIGPIVEPAARGCWLCAMTWWSENADPRASSAFWRALALGGARPRRREDSEIAAQMLGITAALEAYRYFTGAPPPESYAHVLSQNLETLEIAKSAFVPHPSCPRCRGLPPRAEASTETPRSPSAEAVLGAWAPLLGHEFGVFRGFTDGTIEQIPLRVAALEAGDGETVFGWSEKTSYDARLHALVRALARRTMKRDSSGVSDHTNVQGLELATNAPVLVPASAVQPSLGAEAGFDASRTGVGVGVTRDAAREEAVLSLLKHRALVQVAQGTLVLREWDADGDETTRYLRSSLENLGARGVRIGLASPFRGVFVAVLLPADEGPDRAGDLVVATAYSALDAVNKALAEAAARLQVARNGLVWRRESRSGVDAAPAIEGRFDPPASDVRASLADVLHALREEAYSVVGVDVTPPEVERQQFLHVERAILVAGPRIAG